MAIDMSFIVIAKLQSAAEISIHALQAGATVSDL